MASSRDKAREAVVDGRVVVGGAPATKPSRLVSAAEPIELLGPPQRFVSRAGEKLDSAIRRFQIDVSGRRALDAGSSTGGFVDCLLQRGASQVVAVDVGRGQLDSRLRACHRVDLHEGVNVRHLRRGDLGGQAFEIVTADLSFISLRTVARVLLVELAEVGADVVTLVKPQFEAGRREASKGGGVIDDPEIWSRALSSVAQSFLAAGAAMMGVMPSPIKGSRGNVEFLLHARAQLGHLGPGELDISAAVEDAARGGKV